jgi:hypothetical protein
MAKGNLDFEDLMKKQETAEAAAAEATPVEPPTSAV